MQKTLLVTGASTGLGAAIAVLAAQKGFRTFAALRNPAGREKLDALLDAAGVTADVIRLDVESAEAASDPDGTKLAAHVTDDFIGGAK